MKKDYSNLLICIALLILAGSCALVFSKCNEELETELTMEEIDMVTGVVAEFETTEETHISSETTIEETNISTEITTTESSKTESTTESAKTEKIADTTEEDTTTSGAVGSTQVEIPTTSVSTATDTDAPSVELSNSDFKEICKVVEAETHGADAESKKHIVHVILNRVASSQFPGSVSAVCKQKNQFVRRSDIQQSTIDAVTEALNEADTTNGALFFCTCSKGCYASKHKTWLFKDSCGHNFWK